MGLRTAFNAALLLAISVLGFLAWVFYDIYQWMWGGL